MGSTSKIEAYRQLSALGHEKAAIAMSPENHAAARRIALNEAVDAFEQALALDAVVDTEQVDVLLVLPVLLQKGDPGNARGEMESRALPLHERAFEVMRTMAAPHGAKDENAGARAQQLFNYATALYYIAQSKVGSRPGSGPDGDWEDADGAGAAFNVAEAREHLLFAAELLVGCPATARAGGQPNAATRCEKMLEIVKKRLSDLKPAKVEL